MFRLYYVDASKKPDAAKLFLGGFETKCQVHKYYVKSNMDNFLEMGVLLLVNRENIEDVRYCPEELISAYFEKNFLHGLESQKDKKFEMFLTKKDFQFSDVMKCNSTNMPPGLIYCSKFYEPISLNTMAWPSSDKKYAISKEDLTAGYFFFTFKNERKTDESN